MLCTATEGAPAAAPESALAEPALGHLLEPVRHPIWRLGAGAMGVVYAAYDPKLDRKVALKLLKKKGQDEEMRARLVREAQALAQLQHPHVVSVYDVGTVDDQVFVAMELVAGDTQHVRGAAGRRGRPTKFCECSAKRGAGFWRRTSAAWCIAISSPTM